VFVRLYSTNTTNLNAIASPWAVIYARGSLADTDMFTATPASGTPATSVTIAGGAWYDALPAAVKPMYTLQTGFMASGDTPPTSWGTTNPQTVPTTGTRDLWARFNIENRASVPTFGGAYATQATAGVKLGTWSRT
jgi:hypothetical protein